MLNKVLNFDSSSDQHLRYRESRRPADYSVKENFEKLMSEMLWRRPRKDANNKQPKVEVHFTDNTSYRSRKINRDVYNKLLIKLVG